MSLKIVISAGELSGDQHAAELLRELRLQHPELEARGMGGGSCRSAGMEILVDSEVSASVMGGSEVVAGLPKIVSAFRRMKLLLTEWKPDCLIIIDYPDFNLRLAKVANKLGIRVIYFIPPKIWAWREGRLRLIRKVVDHLLVIFPFEVEFYRRRGFTRVNYVGHPFSHDARFADSSAPEISRDEFWRSRNVDPDRPILALFPGSRASEIKRHMEPLIGSARLLKNSHPDLQFVMPIAPSLKLEAVRSYLGVDEEQKLELHMLPGDSLQVMKHSDAGLVKSGTVNLEAALLGLPFVMFYKLAAVSAVFARIFLRLGIFKLREFSIVNIIRPNSVQELLQERADPKQLASEAAKLLFHPRERERVLQNLSEVRELLKEGREIRFRDTKESSYSVAAKRITEFLSSPRPCSNIYSRLFGYIRPFRNVFLLTIVCMVLFGASDGLVPVFIKYVLDDVFANHNSSLLYVIPGALVVFALFRAVVDFGQQYLMSYVGHGIVKNIRNELNRKFLSLSSDFFLLHSPGNLLARTTSDVQLVRELLTTSASSVLRDAVRIVALIATAIYLDPLLAAIALIGFPFGFFPVYKFGKKMRKLSRQGQSAVGALSALLQESIMGQRVVKAFGREAFEIKRFEENNEELTRTFLKSEKVRALTGPVNEVLATLAICAVILYGGLSVIGNTRTQGDFLAFLVAIFLVYDPFKKLSRVNSAVQQGLAGAERIFEVLDTEQKIKDPIQPVSLPSDNDVQFENVSFSYRVDSRMVLSNINLRIESGKTLALVGLSGAGKSTLIDLIPRFIDPTVGAVKIGGIDIRSTSLAELRSRIAMVGQHTFLFNDTVFNNIAYGREGVSAEQVERAADAAHCSEFIAMLKDGYQTIVGEGGFALSGGQRQRIAIARAILKDAPILILDEATASLDNQSELEVQRAIDTLQKNRTCIVIAHRLSTIRNANLIAVMSNGEISELGSHEELIGRGGEYAKLYALHLSGTEDRGDVSV